jgi:uncharacterized protein (DUF58 family)
MRFTVEGKKFLFLTLLIAIAAINTANNLMFLVLSMMLSMLAIASFALWLNMKGLALSVSADYPVYAKEHALLDLRVKNGKRLLNSYSIRVHMPEGLEGEGHIAYVPSGSEAVGKAKVLFRKRGLYRHGDFILESSFPFIFVNKTMKVKVNGEILVYPEMVDDKELLPTLLRQGGKSHARRPGRGEELFGIRELRHGDDIKLVSWRASAKSEKLMVKEFSKELPRTVTVVLDDRMPFHSELFELAVTLSASVSRSFMDRCYFVKLVTSSKVLPLGTGPEHLYRVLELLALVQEGEKEKCVIEDEIKGYSVIVLKSKESSLKALSPLFDSVLYASDL